jgi:hypothetical protein
MPRKKKPELTFQQHLADFLVREHSYGVLEQGEITDTEHGIAEDHLWAFLQDTQSETLEKLASDYGKDARDEVFRALRSELQRQTPLWLLLRHGLKVRDWSFDCTTQSHAPARASPVNFTTRTASPFVLTSISGRPTRKLISSCF